MEPQQDHPVSLIVSAAGWMAAVVVVALALFLGKPHFFNKGYEQGRTDQAAQNVAAVDQQIASQAIQGDNYVVLGRVVSVSAAEIVFETGNPILVNPLRSGPRQQTAVINAQTVIERRTMLPQDEIIRIQEQARSRGLSTQDVVIHQAETISATDLKPGDEISIYPAVVADAVKDSFAARQVLLVISNQTPTTN